MIEEDSAGIGQLDATGAARQQLCAHLVFQVADLTAERRLRRVQPPLGGDREAALLCNSDEIAEMTQFHTFPMLPRYAIQLTKSFSATQ
jgi:hypothetical protein